MTQAVLSGDTLVLVGKATGNAAPQEITVTLASVQAPRISRGPQQATEDPFAFESREFLRKICVGKPASFRVIYCVSSINRTFADVNLVTVGGNADVSDSIQSLAKLVVAAGWCTVAQATGGHSSDLYDELVVLVAQAKVEGLKVHAKSVSSARKINWAPTSAEVEEVIANKGKPVSVIVVSLILLD